MLGPVALSAAILLFWSCALQGMAAPHRWMLSWVSVACLLERPGQATDDMITTYVLCSAAMWAVAMLSAVLASMHAFLLQT